MGLLGKFLFFFAVKYICCISFCTLCMVREQLLQIKIIMGLLLNYLILSIFKWSIYSRPSCFLFLTLKSKAVDTAIDS